MSLPQRVKIVEVGPRDGLQNEKAVIDLDTKVELVERLADAGLPNVEAASFVSPKWVPQMASSGDVMARIRRRPGTVYSALTPNMKGLEAAIAARADEVLVLTAATEAFTRRNINCSIAESIERAAPVVRAAKEAGLRARIALSTAMGCPYEGVPPAAAVVDVLKRAADIGCDEFDIADTIGVATPDRVAEVMQACASAVPVERLAAHFHDTWGMAIANVHAALRVGVATVHSSVAGLGGCPYAKGATGNVATEDVLYLLHGLGIETGVDLDAVVDIGQWISAALGRRCESRVGNALAAKRAAAREAGGAAGGEACAA